jgi:monoamine oxidase
LDKLDHLTVSDLLKRENASAAALEFFGSSGSALQMIWGAAIKKLRGTDLETKKLFRLKGGNQLMTDSFAARLGQKVHLGCPVTAIQHGPSGATVSYREFGQERKLDADYVVSCISLVMLRQLPVTPAWPEAKAFVIREMPYYTRTRIVFQSRTRFWRTDKVSPNWLPPDPSLNEMWSLAEEVNTPRGILIGGGQAGVTAARALATFENLYPGKSAEIEQTIVHDWSSILPNHQRRGGQCCLLKAERAVKLGDFPQSQIIWPTQSRLMWRLTAAVVDDTSAEPLGKPGPPMWALAACE